jgi:putative flippase GtrA
VTLADRLLLVRRAGLPRAGRPIRFALAGVLNTLFGLSIYPALLWTVPAFRRDYLLALVIAQAASLCFAFAVYKLTVFRTRRGAAREFARFLPFYLINYGVNILALPLLVRAGLRPIVAQLIFSGAVMAGSYFWHSRITFSSSGQP